MTGDVGNGIGTEIGGWSSVIFPPEGELRVKVVTWKRMGWLHEIWVGLVFGWMEWVGLLQGDTRGNDIPSRAGRLRSVVLDG